MVCHSSTLLFPNPPPMNHLFVMAVIVMAVACFDLVDFPSSILKVAISKVFTDEAAQWEERGSK